MVKTIQQLLQNLQFNNENGQYENDIDEPIDSPQILSPRQKQTFYDWDNAGANFQNTNTLKQDNKKENTPAITFQDKTAQANLDETKSKALSEFWQSKLNGHETLQLTTDFPRPAQFDRSQKTVHFELDQKTTGRLMTLATELNVSTFSLLASAYCFTLGNYSNQQDIVVGIPVTNGNGLQENTLVLRVKIDPINSAIKYIQSVNDEVIKAQLHQDMPFEKLVKDLNVAEDPSRHPIVQVTFGFNPSEANADIDSKYDLSTTMSEEDFGIKGRFNFCSKIFAEVTVKGMVESFTHILKQYAQLNKDDQRKLANIECVDKCSFDKLMECAIKPFPMNKTIHQMFEEEVAKSPDKIALVYKDTLLTYSELNDRSNQLAHFLQFPKQIQPDALIALFLDKNELMMISILGVWKAGAAYVPIDPSYPDERIQFILKDTKTEIVITNHQYASRLRKLAETSPSIIEIDGSNTTELLSKEPTLNRESNANENNLAYVIYTSGTTGQPKGVLIEHKGVVNLRHDLIQRYFGDQKSNDHQESILFLSNYVFDFSIEQIVLSFLCSNKLILVPSEWTIGDQYYDYVNSNGLSYLSGTPTYICQMDLSRLTNLQILTFSGEAFTKNHFDKIRKEYSGLIVNAYGITETTVYDMAYTFEGAADYKNSLGLPLSNIKLFVLNDNKQLLPRGAIGEMYVAGPCLARGYLNRPELTAQRFVPNPFQTEDEKTKGHFSRLYKTGDLVRLTAEGQLEYLGRNDLQVKINGIRIELSEIETVLSSYAGVLQCAVLAVNHKNRKRLVGYFVSQDNRHIAEDGVKDFMRAKLPAHMIPTRLVRIDDRLPTTINGKLDAKALPTVDFSADKNGYVAPRNTIEEQLCCIWSELLSLPNIGIDDDFFRLGGCSVLSQRLRCRIHKELKTWISVKDIFVYKTIRSLFDNVFGRSQINPKKIDVNTEQGILSGDAPMLPIQERFLSEDSINRNHEIQQFVIKTPQLDLPKLKNALIKLIEHHDAFRLKFRKNGGSYVQYYDDSDSSVPLKVFDVKSGQDPQEVLAQWQSEVDIKKDSIFQVGYLYGYDDGSARVWFAMSRLITDALSWQIICQDLQKLYDGGELGNKGSSYRQWARAVQEYPNRSDTQKTFWQNILNKAESSNSKLFLLANNTKFNKSDLSLTTEQTDNLMKCNQVYGTQQIEDLLQTALAYALDDLTGDKINFVTVVGQGRQKIDDTLDISRAVGCFTKMYPAELNVGTNIRSSIQIVKFNLNTVIPNKGVGFGPIFGYDANLPKVAFNYLGQFDIASKNAWALEDVAARCVDNQLLNNNLINLTGFISNGQMQFNVASRLDAQKSQRFSDVFKSKLEEIIDYANAILGEQSENAIADDFEPYIEFNSQSSDRILFVLPPISGGAESYINNLVQYLPSIRLILFNNYYLHTNRKPTTMEKLAQFYIHYIKQIQPQGPYSFIGWSFGGNVSMEVTRQLLENGDKVDNIMFIDTFFNEQKVSCEIDRTDYYIVDRILYLYTNSHQPSDFDKLVSGGTNIVLFQAKKLYDSYKSNDERLMSEYYINSPYNLLDTLVDKRSIQLIPMEEDTHTSWIYNKRLLKEMADCVLSLV